MATRGRGLQQWQQRGRPVFRSTAQPKRNGASLSILFECIFLCFSPFVAAPEPSRSQRGASRRSWPAVWLRSGSRAPAWRRRRESCSNQILLFSSVSVCPSNSPAHEYHTSIIVRTQVKKELKSFDASFHKFYGRQPRHEPALAPSPLPFLAPQGAEQ